MLTFFVLKEYINFSDRKLNKIVIFGFQKDDEYHSFGRLVLS
jgi:hypothetical protein